ncbi:MAG TPA: sigma-54 dependent transcriptional regulator [Candidatus Brocadiia bacterium]|nr:sigma-54 dependent transcriptional regulator [Candidatus Brocadiia bacterium]
MTSIAPQDREEIGILLVEDDERSRVTVERFLRDEGYDVSSAPDAEKAAEMMAEKWRPVVIVDYRLPGRDGIQFIEETTRTKPGTSCILITAHGDVQSAVRAMKAGAFQFIEKPISPPQLVDVIREACEKERLAIEVKRLRKQLNDRYGFENIIGRSDAIRKVFETIRLAAPTNSTVLLTGESGTGKELVARAIHQNSPRAGGPFVAVNCAALPKDLVESELFGHEQGAYTGASQARRGFFEAAARGTLLIDEVGEMALGIQAKLLRALEQRVITRVGSSREVPVDARIVAASNRNLEEAVANGEFREDLFYRLCVIHIHLPPLRQRQGDIPLLVSHFLGQLNAEHGRHVEEVSPEAMRALEQYAWPGNVRELRNTLESLIVLSGKRRIDLSDLPDRIRAGGKPATLAANDAAEGPLDGPLADIERRAILRALEKSGGNRTKAAQMLDIAVRTVQRKMSEYGLE